MVVLVLVAGCSSSGFVVGARAERARDYVAARDAYRRELAIAVEKQSETNLSRQHIMLATYELGRMTGYTCDYAEAERLLREALRLGGLMPEQFSHLTATLSEPSHLTFDAGEFAESVSFHERAIERLDRSQYVNHDPIGIADYLDEYAAALDSTGGAEAATRVRARADSIRSDNPGKSALSARVEYRDVCGKR